MPSPNGKPVAQLSKTRLKLTMPSPTHSTNLESSAASPNIEQHQRRPSFSPVTPTFRNADADADAIINADTTAEQDADTSRRELPEFITEPDPFPVNLDENSDAIALKAALSILQMQKQQSQSDIKQLDHMKAAAHNDPQAFLHALKIGNLTKAPSSAIVDLDEDADEDGPELETETADPETPNVQFGQFPLPQNIVRTPPINWAKYHLVGDSLDRLHHEQRQRPEPGVPRRDEFGRPPQHVVAAPYRPFVDKFDPVPSSNPGTASQMHKE